MMEKFGGREAFFGRLDKRYAEFTRVWKQDAERIGRILSAPLGVEHFVGMYLCAMNPNLGDVAGARLSYAQKVDLLKARYAVRSAELDVEKNELLSKIDADKNLLALQQAKRELAELESLLADACDGRGALVFISGPRGIGKTRLAQELARDALRRRMVVLQAGSPSFDQVLSGVKVAGAPGRRCGEELAHGTVAPPPAATVCRSRGLAQQRSCRR